MIESVIRSLDFIPLAVGSHDVQSSNRILVFGKQFGSCEQYGLYGMRTKQEVHLQGVCSGLGKRRCWLGGREDGQGGLIQIQSTELADGQGVGAKKKGNQEGVRILA